MPRRARLEVPGIPMHVTQRGINRGVVFVDDADRSHYLQLLGQVALAGRVEIHAYVLMGNHVHLLVSSGEAGAVSSALRRLGQCYVQSFNRRHRRSGPLWEGRFSPGMSPACVKVKMASTPLPSRTLKTSGLTRVGSHLLQ